MTGAMSAARQAPLHVQLGLTDDEHGRIVGILGREPSHAELAMFSVMWSEHCSYKSSKVHLKGMPTGGHAVFGWLLAAAGDRARVPV